LPRRKNPCVARYNPAVFPGQHRVRPAPLLHARGYGSDLSVRMRPGIFRIRTDDRNDLALVRTRVNGIEPLRFREGGKGIRPADGVVALGFPYDGLLATSPQVTTGTVSALAGMNDDTRELQLTAPIQPGNSGGPLLDFSGNVVGGSSRCPRLINI
jgi:hypothetical protein